MVAQSRKRIRRDPATSRALILDATERLMLDEGYAAVSSRRIAQELGINAATVHYHFPTTDDIFIALHRRMTERQMDEIATVVLAEDPLAAFWRAQSSGGSTALGVEFLALAAHRRALRPIFAAATEAARAQQADLLAALSPHLPAHLPPASPLALATILLAIGRLLANEERIGITRGHAEVRALVDALLRGVPQG